MENPLISVIVPIYKVEKYLDKCVQSIVEQTYKNLEIILVDDGSPDNCPKMCDEWAEKDARIKVIHKENGGLSDARNFGVKASNGEYIAFVDSDDYVASNYIEYLYGILADNSADISCCGMVRTENRTTEYYTNDALPPVQLLTGRDACKKLLGELYLVLVTACGRLYRNEIVKKHPFPEGRIHEDEATTCKYYYESEKVVVGNSCLYAYYQNPTSIMHSKGRDIDVDAVWAFEQRALFFEACGEKTLAQLAWRKFLHYCVGDSLVHDGRCDFYLAGFGKRRTLSTRIKLEFYLYQIFGSFVRSFFPQRLLRKILKR